MQKLIYEFEGVAPKIQSINKKKYINTNNLSM